MPVYFFAQWEELLKAWVLIAFATAGVVVGTLGGEGVLRRIPEQVFRCVIGGVILALGALMFFEAGMR